MPDDRCRVTFRRGDVSFSVEGREEYVDKKVEQLVELAQTHEASRTVAVVPANQVSESLPTLRRSTEHSFGDVYRLMSPINNNEKVLVALYHLEMEDGVSPATSTEIEEKLWQVREKVKGVTVYLNRICMQRLNYATPDSKDGKVAYRLVKNGVDFVEGRLMPHQETLPA